MKKINISKRDFLFFVFGVFAMLIFETIYNWEDAKQGFMDGWNGKSIEVKK